MRYAAGRRSASTSSAALRRHLLSSFHNHYARLIEIIFAIERMEQILQQPGILDKDVRAEAKANEPEGVGIIEAPRGTLFTTIKWIRTA